MSLNNLLMFMSVSLSISFLAACSNAGLDVPPVGNDVKTYQMSNEFEDGARILARLNSIFPTDGSMAVEIARRKLNISRSDLDSLVMCDGGLDWHVIYPKKNKDLWVDKQSGEVYGVPIDIGRNVFESNFSSNAPVGKDEAFQIARNHFVEYSKQQFNTDEKLVAGYFPSVCSFGSFWRVYFLPYELDSIRRASDIKNLPNDHAPDYVIDKNSGAIIYFSYLNQSLRRQ